MENIGVLRQPLTVVLGKVLRGASTARCRVEKPAVSRRSMAGIRRACCLLFLLASLFGYAYKVQLWKTFCIATYGLLKLIPDHFVAHMDALHMAIARTISTLFTFFWVFLIYERIQKFVYAKCGVHEGCDDRTRRRANTFLFQMGQLPIYVMVMLAMHKPVGLIICTVTVAYLFSVLLGGSYKKWQDWVFSKKGIQVSATGSAH